MSLENKIITVTEKGSGKQVEKFVANYPNIRSLRGFLNGQWNFALFNEAFKGKNKLGDIDGSIELEGFTLLVEFKGSIHAMNKGQLLKAIRQAKYSNITTYFVFGKRDVPEAYLRIEPDATERGFKDSGYIKADLAELINQWRLWGEYVEANSYVTSKTEEWNEVSEVLGGLYQ